jgi:hypothetical protein
MEQQLTQKQNTGSGSYHCNGCSQSFQSEEALRQHQVDCANDEIETEA